MPLALLLVALTLSIGLGADPAFGVATAQLVGREETVFDWTTDACQRRDIPDSPARAFRDDHGRVQMIASHYIARRMVGPNLNRVKHRCKVVMRSHYSGLPGRFRDREWIGATYTRDGRTIYALVHNEYQGYQHPNRCPSGSYFRCWYNAITLAVSRNGGASFTLARPPGQLVAAVPYPYEPDAGPYGLFDPSNVVQRPADGYYYALLHSERYRDQQGGACLMRTRDLADPASWRAWGGSDFDVRFIDPYRAGSLPPRDHVCQPVSPPQIGNMSQSLTFNTYFQRFLLVGASAGRDPKTGGIVWGIHFALSRDLIHWTGRRLIMEAELPWTYQCGDRAPVLYPSVLDPASRSRNFETSGRSPYLYFTRLHYRRCTQSLNRDLIRRRIRFGRT